MNWMQRMIFGGMLLRAPEGDGGGSGGGAGTGAGEGGAGKGKGDAPDDRDKRIAELEAELKKAKAPPADDPDLQEKARRERDAKEKRDVETRQLESALKFSLGAKDWLKSNGSLLPKEIEGIFTAAEKENYGSALEKDAAVKAGIIQEFFKIQANLDLLTPSLKTALEDFLKLTKNGRQEKAQHLYDSVFEPAFEMLKRVKKAEQLNASGGKSNSDSENAYRDRMISLSRKHYLGEKN
jgi:hypothetical protein